MNRTANLLFTLGAMAALAPAFAQSALLLPQKPIQIPGKPGGFDYMTVDAKFHRVFATHKGCKNLAVVDTTANTALPSPEVGTTQGIAIDKKNGLIYLGGEEEHRLVILDRKTLKMVGTVPTDGPIDDIKLDPKNGMVYAEHDDGDVVWVIDPALKTVTASITIPELPEFIEAIAPKDLLFVNIKGNNTLQVIDLNQNKILHSWDTTPATSPHGMAIDTKKGWVFTAGSNGKLVVFDVKTGKQIATADIAPGVDQITFDPGTHRIYCACHGMVSVVEETEDGVKSLGDVAVPKTAHTIAVDPKTHSVWICYFDTDGSYLQEYKLPANG